MPRLLRYGLHFIYSFFYTLNGALRGTYRAIIAQSPYEALAPALALLPWKLFRSRTKPRLIVEVHSDWGEGAMLYHHYSPLAWLEKPLRKLVGSVSLSQADAYRVISEYCRSLVPDNKKPVFVFPTFTDLDSFSDPSLEVGAGGGKNSRRAVCYFCRHAHLFERHTLSHQRIQRSAAQASQGKTGYGRTRQGRRESQITGSGTRSLPAGHVRRAPGADCSCCIYQGQAVP